MTIKLPDLTMVRDPAAWRVSNHRAAEALALRAQIWADMGALVTQAERENRGLLASEQRDYDAAEAVLAELTQIHDESHVDRSVLPHGGAAGFPTNTSGAYAVGRALTRGQTFEGYVRARELLGDEEEQLDLGRYCRGLLTGRWEGAEAERRAMAEGTDAAGGFLVPTMLSAQIIDLVRNSTRVMQAGATVVPMESRRLDVARWEGDPTAAWHSENAAISPSDATLGKVTLTAQALASIVQVSWELLEDAPDVEGKLGEAFASAFSLRVDQAALYGSGTAPEPRGVKNVAAVVKTPLAPNGATLANYDPLIDSVGRLDDANEEATGIIYAGRSARALSKLKDTTNQPLAVPEYIAAVPRYSTKQVATNLSVGTSNDTSDIFTADWRQLLVGVRTQLRIALLDQRYADYGQTGFLAWWRGDIAVARPAAFDVVTGVRP